MELAPPDALDLSADYERVRRAIAYLDAHYREQPSLDAIAAEVGLSPYHFQRLFQRWAGVSPKRFVQALTAAHAKRLLRRSETVLGSAFEVGLSGAGRLHDLLVTLESVTPGEVRGGGAGLVIRYGVHASPFGPYLLATTERGVCALSFLDEGGAAGALRALATDWPGAVLAEDPAATAPFAARLFRRDAPAGAPLRLHVRGTAFQVRVWEALLRIPSGHLVSYEDVASAASAPGATRAVGTAIGRNPVAVLIPCHRVIRKTGAFGGYRWDLVRKRALHAWEAAGAEEAAAA
jgi:AraC family transcriptional regulator, regulatory protein of adaptative response / methylated-DNA-[protein]-cysteine methyltransferase